MPNANDLPKADEPMPPVCSRDCYSCGKAMLRAAVYAPVILILGALAALVMFPDLADYGYPLIGNPSHIGFNGEPPCSIPIGKSDCSVQATLPGSCSFPSNTSASNATERTDCWPMSRARQNSSETTVESAPDAESASGDFMTDSETIEEIFADATLPLNFVDSEVPLS